jgi:hypothetical protein
MGRTREERLAFMKSFDEMDTQHRLDVDKQELGLMEEDAQKQESMRKKRREYA